MTNGKFNFKNNVLIKRICAGTLALTALASLAGCKKDQKIVIAPGTSLVEMYDAVKDSTTMDEFVEREAYAPSFDYTNLNNLENEDMAEVNRRIFNVGLNQLKGMAVDALGLPLELVESVKFYAPTYTMDITFVGGKSSISVKLSGKNIENLVNVITSAQSGVVRASFVKEAYDIVKLATLLTGEYDEDRNKISFKYDESKIEKAQSSGLVR